MQEDAPRIYFYAGRDRYRGMDCGIKLAWGLIPLEERRLGHFIYRHGVSLSWSWLPGCYRFGRDYRWFYGWFWLHRLEWR